MITKLSKKPTLLALVILTLAVLIPYWKLALMQGFIITDDIFTSDMMNASYPYRHFLGNVLQSGYAPSWITLIYGGFPLIALSEAGACYPLNLVLFGLLPPHIALNVVILLTLMTAAICMYFYVREIGGNFVAGLIGGAAFAFSGYLVSHIKHLSNLNAACWLPLGLWLIERAFQRKEPGYLWLIAIVFGLQHLSGHTQIAYYSGVVYIVYYLVRYKHYRREMVREKLPATSIFKNRFSCVFLGGLLVGSSLGAVQLLPTYELVSLSQRSGGVTYDYAANYAYDPKNIFTFFYPYINGDIGAATYSGNSIFWEDYGYVGISMMAFALYAAFRLWKNPYVKAFSMMALVSFFLVLGPNTPLYEAVFHLVPGMKYFRFPTRFLLVTDFSLIVLGCIGVTQIMERLKMSSAPVQEKKSRPELFSNFGVVAFVVVVADLWYFQLRQNPIVDADRWLSRPKTVGLMQSRTLEASLDDRVYRIFVVGGNESHKRAFARARGWQGDLQPYVDQREFLQTSSNVLYGLFTPDGYANFIPNYLVEIWGDQNRGGLVYETATVRENTFYPTPAFWKLMNMYCVRFILSLWPINHEGELKDLGKTKDVFVYENPHAFPVAYLVQGVKRVQNIEEAKRVLISSDFDPGKEAILFESPRAHLADSVRGRVKVIHYNPNSVEFQVSSNSEALLVFSDSYYPGWRAEVDERETPVFQANVTQRAVAVPAGDHSVKFAFRSRPITYGFWISGVGFAIFMGIFLVEYIKRKPQRS